MRDGPSRDIRAEKGRVLFNKFILDEMFIGQVYVCEKKNKKKQKTKKNKNVEPVGCSGMRDGPSRDTRTAKGTLDFFGTGASTQPLRCVSYCSN